MKKLSIFLLLTCYYLMQLSASNQSDTLHGVNCKIKEDVEFIFDQNNAKVIFSINELDALLQTFDVESIREIGSSERTRTFNINLVSGDALDEFIEALKLIDCFEYVETNYIGKTTGQSGTIVPNDHYFYRQWGLYNDGDFPLAPSTISADVDMREAWDIEQGDSSIVVAILDSGIKIDHIEFEGRLWKNTSEEVNFEDSDGNGYIDDIYGWNFVSNTNNVSDDNGHGTNVAGIVGANGNNDVGYVGADWNCKLMICKILDADSRGYYTWWMDAIYYAVDHGADVINMSVSGTQYSYGLKNAVEYAHDHGVLIVSSMHNENSDDDFYPALYPTVMAIGATDANDNRAVPFFWSDDSGSNYGDHIDVVAPGNYIYGLSMYEPESYNYYWGGTSQASPLVAGIASLLLAQDSTRTPDQLREIIQKTSEDQVGDALEDTPGFDRYYGYGRVNAFQALKYNETVGSRPLISQTDFKVFPNPASSTVYISSEISEYDIDIYNNSGVLVLNQSTSTRGSLDVSQLPSGIYIVKISSEEGVFVSKLQIV